MTEAAFQFGNLDDWRTDAEKERSGVPLDLGGGRVLLVRRANVFDKALQAEFAKIDAKNDRQVQGLFARTIVAGWIGILDPAGEPVPFSEAACMALFTFAPDVWDELQRFAMNRANYRLQKIAEDREAVKPLSDGEKAQERTSSN
jgi:hypothetical protein